MFWPLEKGTFLQPYLLVYKVRKQLQSIKETKLRHSQVRRKKKLINQHPQFRIIEFHQQLSDKFTYPFTSFASVVYHLWSANLWPIHPHCQFSLLKISPLSLSPMFSFEYCVTFSCSWTMDKGSSSISLFSLLAFS